MTIRVIETDSATPGGVRFSTRPAPVPKRGEVLIEVSHIALNFGETRRAVRGLEPDGAVLGWDTSGIVVGHGPDTLAPPPGTRVVARGLAHGWAEQRVADVGDIAVVPDGVGLAEAASLPTAAGTAFGTLQRAGSLLGKTVLVTGASGGVGRAAVQLARIGGARVIAVVGSEASAQGLHELGADLVSVNFDGIHEEVDVVIESVGGQVFVQAWKLLRRHGMLQSLGWASNEDAILPPLSTVGPNERILQGFVSSQNRYGQWLAPLLRLVESGQLHPEIKWRGSWERFGEAADLLLGRTLRGKAILEIER